MESNKAFRALSYVVLLSLLLVGDSVATYPTCSQIMSCKTTQVMCYLGCLQHFGYYSFGICTPSGSQVPPASPQVPPASPQVPPAGPQVSPGPQVPPAGPQDPPPAGPQVPAGPQDPAPAAGPQVPPPALLQSFENEQNWGGRDEPCQCRCVFPKGYQQECPPSNPPAC